MNDEQTGDFLDLLVQSTGWSGTHDLPGNSAGGTPVLNLDTARLESTLFACLAQGLADERVRSIAALLNWPDHFSCFAIGGVPAVSLKKTSLRVHQAVLDLGGEHCLVGLYRNSCILLALAQGAVTPEVTCTAVLDAFDDQSAVCLGKIHEELQGGVQAIVEVSSSMAASSALDSATMYRPLRTDDLLPERALIGDQQARMELYRSVYSSLLNGNQDDPTLITVKTFLDSGSSLDTTARELNVHANTVRYRLRRAAETTGWDATDPRDAFVLHTAIAIGRIHDAGTSL